MVGGCGWVLRGEKGWVGVGLEVRGVGGWGLRGERGKWVGVGLEARKRWWVCVGGCLEARGDGWVWA